jgi:regulatory factor X
VAHHGAYQDQWHNNDHGAMPHSKDMPIAGQQMGSQMTAEEIILRPGQQMPLPPSFPMNSTMHQSVNPAMPYAQHQILQHGMQPDPYGAGGSFTDADSQMMEREDLEDGDLAEATRPAGQKSGSSRTSANNELEMRQLYQANRHRKLEEVARELHGNERGPNSERTRQVFAMLWYVVC